MKDILILFTLCFIIWTGILTGFFIAVYAIGCFVLWSVWEVNLDWLDLRICLLFVFMYSLWTTFGVLKEEK